MTRTYLRTPGRARRSGRGSAHRDDRPDELHELLGLAQQIVRVPAARRAARCPPRRRRGCRSTRRSRPPTRRVRARPRPAGATRCGGPPPRLRPGAQREHRCGRPQRREVGRRIADQRLRLAMRLGEALPGLAQKAEGGAGVGAGGGAASGCATGGGDEGRGQRAWSSRAPSPLRRHRHALMVPRHPDFRVPPGVDSATRTERSHTPGPARIRSTNSRAGASGSSADRASDPPAAQPIAPDRHRRRERPRRLLDPPLAHVRDQEPRDPRTGGAGTRSVRRPASGRGWAWATARRNAVEGRHLGALLPPGRAGRPAEARFPRPPPGAAIERMFDPFQ